DAYYKDGQYQKLSTLRSASADMVSALGSLNWSVPSLSDEEKPVSLWEQTKAWADKNRAISGALIGGAAGPIVPRLGTVIGAIVGAGVGFASSKEKKEGR